MAINVQCFISQNYSKTCKVTFVYGKTLYNKKPRMFLYFMK